MDTLGLTDPDFIPMAMVGLITLGLAIAVLLLDPGSRLNRVFAAFLLIRVLTSLLGPATTRADTLAMQVTAAHFLGYVFIAAPAVLLYFMSIYPTRRGMFGTTRWGPLLLFGVTGGIMVWYSLDHAIMTLVEWTGERMAYTDGPLVVLVGGRTLFVAAAGVWLAREYSRRAAGSQGYSLFLLAAAFAIGSLVNGGIAIGENWDRITGVSPYHYYQASSFTGWTWTIRFLPMFSLVLGLVAVAYMITAMRLEKGDATLNEARRFVLFVTPLAVASAWLAGRAPSSNVLNLGSTPFINFTIGFWGLTTPLLITYALLRFSLFDADIRLKAGVRRAIVAGAFAITFFVVSEAAEALFTTGRGAWFGFAGAAVLALGARPLQLAAERAANALMPDTEPLHTLSPRRREVMYREQFLLVEADGQVTAKERRMLDGLAEALHLDEDQTMRLECSNDIRGDATPLVAVAKVAPPRVTTMRRVAVALTTAVVFALIATFLEAMVPVSDFAVGLLSSAAITLLLGPIESLVARIGQPEATIDPASAALYRKELEAALEDGVLSRRDKRYLAGLAEHLGIDRRTRSQLNRRALALLAAPAGLSA